ncbi:MAG: tetratricopeptide repeat protein, partial [Gammaproteobacteria bacterium]|nr:tetratricopeptide repeat protein [Gammaproteobacteria bacterium]
MSAFIADSIIASEYESEYRALHRALEWIDDFGLFFVECVPVQSEQLYQRITAGIPRKKTHLLRLEEEVDSLYDTVAALTRKEHPDILFIQGLEKSFVPYIKAGYGGEGEYYKQDSVPRVLGHLNLERERFRERFSFLSFVFLLPRFGLKYFIRRAPDFFDWRSGVFSFNIESGVLEQAQFTDVDYKVYLDPQQRQERSLEIAALLEESQQPPKNIAALYREQGRLLEAENRTKEALVSYENALKTNPDYYQAWRSRGLAFNNLGQYAEAIACYNKALQINPEDIFSWFHKGYALAKMGRYEESIESCHKTLQINPGHEMAWNSLGANLVYLGRFDEAVDAFRKQLKLEPDHKFSWFNLGSVLEQQGRLEEATEAYQKQIELNPEHGDACFGSVGNALWRLSKTKEAEEVYKRGLSVNPNDIDILCNDTGLAVAQGDQERCRKRVAAVLPLLEASDDNRYAIIPFLTWV